MEAASTSETSVNFYQTTWCNNPEDSHLRFNPVQNFTHLLITSSHLRLGLPNSISFEFYNQNVTAGPIYISYLPHACYMFRPSQPPDLMTLQHQVKTIKCEALNQQFSQQLTARCALLFVCIYVAMSAATGFLLSLFYSFYIPYLQSSFSASLCYGYKNTNVI
jgi:hypothetical protein